MMARHLPLEVGRYKKVLILERYESVTNFSPNYLETPGGAVLVGWRF